MDKIFAVVVGAGRGRRFGGETPKQYLPLAGEPVFRRSLRAFAAHPRISAVLPVIAEADRDRFASACGDLPVLEPIDGGASRSASVRGALAALASQRPTHVLVHDAARPLVDQATIDRVVDALREAPAVVPAVSVRDTLKRTENDAITATVDRSGLVAVQTPQGFRYDLLAEAHAAGDEATDDAGLVERHGVVVRVVPGAANNLKITEAEDLHVGARLLQLSVVPRVGTGFDVHRLADGDGVVLGGVPIPTPLRLVGHSDADVALHALTDALLGTLGIGDIGTLFPPTDERWRGADSAIFIREACRRVDVAGGRITHLDLTLLCERPKIGPHREAMRTRIADLCSIGVDAVSVKATTTERLGFTGRGEGIAAQAAATVLYPA